MPGPRDFGQVWFAARSLLRDVDPYPLVGPGLTFQWDSPLVYPLTAALLAIPFTPFPEPVASMLFAALGGAVFAWVLMAYGYGPLFGFFSLSMREASAAAQWSPIISACFVLAPLSFILIAKPTIGVALFVARPSWWAVAGGVILLTAAYLVQPTWIADWMGAVERYREMGAPNAPYRAIVSFPGGALALLCLLRWRRPEARLIAALVCVPITPMLYETLPLFLIPRTFWEAATLVGLSYAQHHVTTALVPVPWTHANFMAVTGQMFVLLMYLPATIMILRRPNEGALPSWVERRIARWPAWLRGRPASGAPSSA